MSRPIKIKFDNSLPDEQVKKPLIPSSIKEGGDVDTGLSEIKITGTYTPLIKFNEIVLPWQDVDSMNLQSIGFLPELSITFRDSLGSILMIDTPSPDNRVILELIPNFDNIYKKIKLTFYVSNINVNDITHRITTTCRYYCDKLYDSNIESFGKISTYKFYEKIASRLKLGLCSNLDDSQDLRYIYMASNTFHESLIKERNLGGTSTCVLDSWIDLWNNINIVDLYDLYKGAPDQNLKVWETVTMDVDGGSYDNPIEIDATITNNPKTQQYPLYTKEIQILSSNSKNYSRGTDRAYNIFDIKNNNWESSLIQDASGVKEKVFTKFYYNGEFDSEKNDGSYLYAPEYRDMFIQKMSNNTIRIGIPHICFGLMRGGKVNVEWYDDSFANKDAYKNNEDISTNININSSEISVSDDELNIVLNKTISGQYYIMDTSIKYTRDREKYGSSCNMMHYFTLTKETESFRYSDLYK